MICDNGNNGTEAAAAFCYPGMEGRRVGDGL